MVSLCVQKVMRNSRRTNEAQAGPAAPLVRRRRTGSVWAASTVRLALLAALIATPLLSVGAIVVASASRPDPIVPDPVPSAEVLDRSVRYVTAFVTADDLDDLDEYIDSDSTRPLNIAPITPLTVTVAATDQVDDGWTVTVAVTSRVGTGGEYSTEPSAPEMETDFYAVTFRHGIDGWSTDGFPSRVGDPASTVPMRTSLERIDESDARYITAVGWLDSYLAGSGAIDRYSAPDLQIAALTPPPYAAIEVIGFTPTGHLDRPTVAVTVTATTGDGNDHVLAYVLELSSRDGRWEVAAITTHTTNT